DALLEAKRQILAHVVGETGYATATDANAGPNYGVLTMHPLLEGTSMLNAKDHNGVQFMKEMLDKREGVIRYYWMNPERDETVPREKTAVYSIFEPWNWSLSVGSYTEEFTRDSNILRNYMVGFAGAAVLIMVALLVFIAQRMIAQPLRQAVS